MECHDNKLLIEAYWDRHLPPEMAERVERHLDECPDCRAEYGPVTRLLKMPERVETPLGLRDRILSSIEPLPMPVAGTFGESFRLRWWLEKLHAPWAGALAACLTFAFLGWISSQIPVGPGDRMDNSGMPAVSVASPNPVLAASWAQTMAVRGPGGPLAALAQATVLEGLIAAPDAAPVTSGLRHSYVPDLPPTDSTPDISEMTILVHRLSTLGT